ncbi:MAG: hypothetical protein IJ089_01370 [Clostridia bacterium]|nr:hypothetical protein [Clostridia bacterium]
MNLDDVAYLFVEQYESIHGLYSESYRPSEVDLIRRTADKGEAALYTVVATVFGDKLDEVLVSAANGAMDYIAYVDETWDPKDAEDKAKMLAMEAVHLESLEAIIRMAQMNGCGAVDELERIRREATSHFQRLKGRAIKQ